MHRILMRTLVLDFPADVHDRARDFWQQALAAESWRGTKYPEYHVFEHPAAVDKVMVQKLGDGASRVHLDIESDDRKAEVARLLSLGATVVAEHEDWTVLSDPAGLVFCVVPAESDDFVALSHQVGSSLSPNLQYTLGVFQPEAKIDD